MNISPYGTLAVILEGAAWRYSFAGYSAPNARTVPTVRMFSKLLDANVQSIIDAAKIERAVCFVQFNDYAHHDVSSTAYGTRKGHEHLVTLIPDTYFFFSNGYDSTRQSAARKLFADWSDRLPLVFWRGSPTTSWVHADGTAILDIRNILRVKLCDHLRSDPRADVGITGLWGEHRKSEVFAYLTRRDLLRPAVQMHDHAKYRYQIDIDGVANAWSFFDKMLMGSCILKVESQFKQWFYDEIRPWEHYVPVRADLSDLNEKLDWSYDNPAAARDIAIQAQQFALSYTYQRGIQVAQQAFRSSLIPF